ncbi:hypothetical protein QE152_g32364 [Popillia japonica]|uniref:C2H2-type domain-containing protein n=1 Tax=Popillia japonica TaxID=7064 RepID=A0AAW1IZ54_POPJA
MVTFQGILFNGNINRFVQDSPRIVAIESIDKMSIKSTLMRRFEARLNPKRPIRFKAKLKIMATTLLNNCTYPNCAEKCSNLEELIYHIEENHIDFSLAEIEEQTEPLEYQCVPLSYILKYSQLHPKPTQNKETFKKILINKVAPIKLEKYAFPNHDGAIMDSEISHDIFNDDKFKKIIRYSRNTSFTGETSEKVTFGKQITKLLCPVPNCGRSCKNINGIKHHIKRMHNKEAKVVKSKKLLHKCNNCGKLYKTINGLKKHSIIHKKVKINLKIVNPSTSQSSVGQSIQSSASSYMRQTDMPNKKFTTKSQSLAHPFSDGDFIFNEGLTDGLILAEANSTKQLMKKY